MYIKYLFMTPIMILVYLLSYLLSPFISLISVIANRSELPWPFYYFYTNDDDLDGGQHQHGWDPTAKGFKLWWQRTLWICRNPGYGFAAYVLGFKESEIEYQTNVSTGDDSSGFTGPKTYTLKTKFKMKNGKRYFSYRRNQHLWGNRYIKMWFGWNYVAYDGTNHMFKCMINPFLSAKD